MIEKGEEGGRMEIKGMRRLKKGSRVFVDPRLSDFNSDWEKIAMDVAEKITEDHPDFKQQWYQIHFRLTGLEEWDDVFGLGELVYELGKYSNQVAVTTLTEPEAADLTVEFIFTQQHLEMSVAHIVDTALNLFKFYKNQHPDLDDGCYGIVGLGVKGPKVESRYIN